MSERDIFFAVLDLPDPAERVKYLDAACGEDTALRAKVERLLHSHEAAGSFLDLSPLEPDQASTRAFAPPVDALTHTQGELREDDTDDAVGFLTPPRRADSLGRIGHYEVLEVLGRGGFGIVFRAFDDVLQRVVAVKVLAPSMAATSPARKRFLREARSAALIQHENVVRIHETGEEPLPFLVMEFVPGETLQHRLDRSGPFEVAEALTIACQIAVGLDAAHEKGLIHRDIKPSNILIDSGPQQVKITDFGLARAADDASLTRSGVVAGTPMYMAPEQAKGESLDQRADLFSLGSVMYAMLTGHPPFRASNTPAVLKRVAEDDPRPLREVIPEIPEWLCRIVEKLHAKEPAERFQSAKEVAELLTDCEKQLAAHKELTDFARIPGGKPKPQRRWIGRHWKWVAATAFLVLLAVWFGPWQLLYLSNRGELELLPEEGLVSVIVLQNDEGDLTTDKLHTPVTDWLGMKTSHTLKLPPGRYQLNVGTYPAGTHVTQWEVTTSGAFGSSEVTVPVIRTSAIVTVERGQRTTLRAIMRTDPPRPEPPPTPQPTEGFVSLFNGRDLTGWKQHPDAPGKWTAGNGILKGSEEQGYLFTERGDYENFHLRFEAKINSGGDSSIMFRAPFKTHKIGQNPGNYFVPESYTAYLHKVRAHGRPTGSLARSDNSNAYPTALFTTTDNSRIKPDEWFTYELIADGNRFFTKINGQEVANCTDPLGLYGKGHIALCAFSEATQVQFRKVEIKELPASSPEVPKRAADVLGFIKGTWKREAVIVEPKLPLAKARSSGQLTFDSVADGKVMRGLTVDKDSKSMSLILHSYDAATDWLRSWSFSAEGEATASKAGAYNPANRSFLWVEPNPDGTQSTHHMDFVDANTVTTRNYDTDASGNFVYESRGTFTRTNLPPAVPKLDTDPKRPVEMKVLDRLVGEWRDELTVKNATPPKIETVRTNADAILGGRYVEVFETNETTGKHNYNVVWFDPNSKQYRSWCFTSDGAVNEFSGTWDEATKTMIWNSKDKTMEGRWVFKRDDQREFQHTIKDKDGKVLNEVKGVSIRQVPGNEAQVPKRVADVPSFLVGSWIAEKRDFEPNLPAEQALNLVEVAYEFVANNKYVVLRHRDAWFLYSFDTADAVRFWYADSTGLAVGPIRGAFTPDNNSLLWKQDLDNGIEFIHQLDFLDVNAVGARVYRRAKATNALHKIAYSFTRAKGKSRAPSWTTDPKRPDEMRVLDRLFGDWQNDVTVTNSATPNNPKRETIHVKAGPILGGRFVEAIETNDATKKDEYMLLWFDAETKQYREWCFSSGGYVVDFKGTWNESNNTMTWISQDKKLDGRWVFKSNTEREYTHLIKDADGKTLIETLGVSRKLDGSAKK